MLRFPRIFLYVLRSLFLIFILIYRSILIYFFLEVPFAYPRRTAKAFLSTNNRPTSCSTSPVADKTEVAIFLSSLSEKYLVFAVGSYKLQRICVIMVSLTPVIYIPLCSLVDL